MLSNQHFTHFLLRGSSIAGEVVDLFGPFQRTWRGNVYCMVCIEHFSKWIEIIPIPNKEAGTVAFALFHHVLSRFRGCAEVLTDRGTEFQGEFQDLPMQAFIDHRTMRQGIRRAMAWQRDASKPLREVFERHVRVQQHLLNGMSGWRGLHWGTGAPRRSPHVCHHTICYMEKHLPCAHLSPQK